MACTIWLSRARIWGPFDNSPTETVLYVLFGFSVWASGQTIWVSGNKGVALLSESSVLFCTLGAPVGC